MKRLFTAWLIAMLGCCVTSAQQNTSKIYQYSPGDGGIIYSMTRGNRWAIINLGTSASGGTAVSQLFDMDSGEHFPVTYRGRQIPFNMASNDGNIVVGHMGEYAVTYNRATETMHSYPNRPLWKNGQLVDCTPDGHYAVGYYEGYLGKSEDGDIPNDWFYRTLYVDVEKGDTIHTPNLPTRNRMGGKLQSIKFSNITPDGRYISGAVDWYIDGGFNFIYDTQTQQCITGKSLMQLYGGDIAGRYEDVESCSGSMMSPNGNAIGGTARIRRNGTTENVPCVYFRDRDELITCPDAEEGGVNICDMDDAGTFFGINETGTPLRNFKILYAGKYWVTLGQICRQRYSYDFYERTGYERTGTIMGVSGDGHKFISFHDPMGESYCFDFGESVEEACSHLDLLGTYSTTPEAGSQFTKIGSMEIRFERPVQILGSGRNVHLLDADGNKVADGLTSTSGLIHKTGSTTTVVANFRPRLLNAGETYTVVIDEGAIATAVDATCRNKEIRVSYVGRENAPVQLTQSTPADHSEVQKIDNVSSYVLLSFDCRVQLTDEAEAWIERVADGSIAASLHLVAGTSDETKHQVLMYPAATVNLYCGQDYRIVVREGSVTDYSGDAGSGNERITLTLHGSYQRVVPTGDILFQDGWDDIAESLQNWLRYEGDHHTPLASMQAWEFDADNQPWNFSIRESEDQYDYCAASHSLYAPSAQSDDWMMTPQVSLPREGRCSVEFDAQSYLLGRSDTLEVYVYEQEWVLSYLNDEWMEDIRQDARLVFKEILSPGATQEGLSGEWTHYSIDLTPWAGKDVYVAFVNHNCNQSAIFIDNVCVRREVAFELAFDYEDRVVARESLPISGKLTIRKDGVDSIALALLDGDGREVSRQEWPNVSGNIKDRPIPFTFPQPLPLKSGEVNRYVIDVVLGMGPESGGNGLHDTYQGTVTNLTFQPTKRVVLEEMTGVDCPNCPLGIQVISMLEKSFGDRIIPISIHTYTGDPYESGMTAYSQFLGLNAAPSARIDRIPGIFYPMASQNGNYMTSNPDSPLWTDIVSRQLDRLALCDLTTAATVAPDGKSLECQASVRSAITTSGQQLSLLFVVLEDGLEYYQSNAFGTISSPLLDEWGQGGQFSGDETGYAYPVIHNDVARSVIGTTLSGTLGLLSATLLAGTDYTATVKAAYPSTVLDPTRTHLVCLLIDSQSGEVVNAARCPILDASTGMAGTDMEKASQDVYNLTGQLILRNATPAQLKALPKGIYVVGGRKKSLGL